MFRIPRNKKSEKQFIDVLNWPDSFPERPEVAFSAWHDGANLHIEYEVCEEGTKAEETTPGNEVYMDSCVECFIQPDPADPHYYNFEWNAIGNLAMACRTGRNDPEKAPLDIIGSVEAIPSLPRKAFSEQHVGKWTLNVCIPAKALFNSGVESFDGRIMKMNLFKCGDGLKRPHYLTWQKINTPGPDDHRPEFFVEVEFE